MNDQKNQQRSTAGRRSTAKFYEEAPGTNEKDRGHIRNLFYHEVVGPVQGVYELEAYASPWTGPAHIPRMWPTAFGWSQQIIRLLTFTEK